MNDLKVTKEWLGWFQKNGIEGVTTIDNKELFTYIIKGKLVNQNKSYKIIFYLLDCFKKTFDFVDVNKIRLEHVDKLSENELQFFKKGEDYTAWKSKIINNHNHIISTYSDYEDGTDIYFNYHVSYEQKQHKLLYEFPPYDITGIYLWCFKNNILEYEVNIEMRKILFYHDSYFEFNLPEEILAYNQSLLLNADAKFKNLTNNILN